MQDLLSQLALAREQQAQAKQLRKAAEETFQTELAYVLDQEKTAGIEVERLTTLINQATITAYIQTGDVPHPAVGVRKMTKYRYESGQVIEWIIENYQRFEAMGFQFLQVNEKALLDAIKKGQVQCEFLRVEYDLMPTISQSLSRILGGQGEE